MERTLVLIKPDAVKRSIIGKIINTYEINGLVVKALKMVSASAQTIDAHYHAFHNESFYPSLKTYMTSGPLVAMILEGNDAIYKARQINGATRPSEAALNTIRALYGVTIQENTVHASEDAKAAQAEIAIWFKE